MSENPYDFILNPAPKAKRRPLQLSGNRSMGQRAAIVGGGFLLLIILLAVGLSVLNRPPAIVGSLKDLAATQAEMQRVANVAAGLEPNQDTAQLTATMDLVFGSHVAATSGLVAAEGSTVKPSELAALSNDQRDAALAAAATPDELAAAVASTTLPLLDLYLQQLRTAFEQTSSQEALVQLQAFFDSAENLRSRL